MSRRGLIILLLASVALNLFVIGVVAGAALMLFRDHGPPPGPPRPPMFAMAEDLGGELTPAHREQWMTNLRQAAIGAGPRLRQSHELRRQAWGRLAADPVNAQAVLADLTQARELELQARGDIDRTVVTFAAGLSVDERKRLADKLSHARMGGPRMMFSGRGPGPGHEPPLPDR